MARDILDIGPVPNDEECAQVGSPDYYERSRKECKAYINQLLRAYPDMPDGMYLKITSNPHDFGTYHEVAVAYDDENESHNDYVYGKLEYGCETWDDEARKELGLDA